MAGTIEAAHEACYDRITAQDFRFYVVQSREHETILQRVTDVLHRDFNRYCRASLSHLL